MSWFPTYDGNQISPEREDSDTYIRGSLWLPLIGTRGIQIFSRSHNHRVIFSGPYTLFQHPTRCQKANIKLNYQRVNLWFPLGRGIIKWFPTLDGNQISSDEQQQQQQQQDSDTNIGVAFGSTYWNKGGQFSNLLYSHNMISRMFQGLPTCKGWLNNNSKWPTKMADITIWI